MAPGVPDSWRMGDVMDEPSREWLRIARPMYQPLTESAERFFSIEGGQGAGALAALDQLVAACSGFRGWLKSHPCPNYELGAHFDAYVAAFGELADEVRTAGLRPIPDEPALRARVKELLKIIEKHSDAVEHWDE